MPLVIAFRDNPQTRPTIDTPPYPSPRASFAAIMRRVRSSSRGQIALNFSVNATRSLMPQLHNQRAPNLLPLFITAVLITCCTDQTRNILLHRIKDARQPFRLKQSGIALNYVRTTAVSHRAGGFPFRKQGE